MAQRLIYHWKHGWIPLDHYAALQKAHGRESGARLLEKRLGLQSGDGKSRTLEKNLAQKVTGGGPLSWRPGSISQDGTLGSRQAAGKAKQVFEAGNKRVVIEASLSKAKTAALLADIAHVVEQSGVHDVPVTFRVPSGDPHFKAMRRGTTGGYVLTGGKTVHISPHVASEDAAGQGFGMSQSGKFMPANAQTPARQWVITHELGHVVDYHNGHTQRDVVSRDKSGQLAKRHQDTLSRYGKNNVQEAYAEAYAQWVHGGPGSNPAADAFAAEYGWPTPKKFQ